MQRPFPNGIKYPFGCSSINSGCVTAVAVGQRQRLYSGVRIYLVLSQFYKCMISHLVDKKGPKTDLS